MVETDAAQALNLELRRIIRAPRQRIYDAWTRPELIEQWFGPEGMGVAHVENDLRVGGKYRIEMAGEGSQCEANAASKKPSRPAAYGIYEQIVPNELLVFTWRGDCEAAVPDTRVTLRFRDTAEGTEITLLHENLASEAMVKGHNHGWNGRFIKLERLLSI